MYLSSIIMYVFLFFGDTDGVNPSILSPNISPSGDLLAAFQRSQARPDRRRISRKLNKIAFLFINSDTILSEKDKKISLYLLTDTNVSAIVYIVRDTNVSAALDPDIGATYTNVSLNYPAQTNK